MHSPSFASRYLFGIALLATTAAVLGFTPQAQAQFNNTPYSTYFGQNKVTYESFDFWKYSAPHFDIYYYPEEEQHLDEVVAFAEAAYERISRKMNHQLSERMPIIFYQTHQDFQQTHILPFFLPEGVAAFAEPTQNRLVLPVDDPPDQLHLLMVHEVTHLFEFDYFFGNRLSSTLRAQPPGWVMEGFAEYMADNLTTLDEMMLRDVVLSDDIPTLIRMSYFDSFFNSYVLGEVVWNYIEEEYGDAGVRIFLSEIRRDLGQDIERDLERAFNVTPNEFNTDFREWLRDRYLPNVLDHSEGPDFARNIMADIPFQDRQLVFSPVVSPAGDEFAAISINPKTQQVDIYTFDLATGRPKKNLTGGHHGNFEYVIGQGVTVGFQAGNDLTYSNDGTQLAFFARTPPTRTLFVVEAATGKIRTKFKTDLDQALSPSVGPDNRVVFAAHSNGVRDIYLFDPRTETLSNLTQDDFYDYAPIWSPDGQSIIFASHVMGHKKLFRIDLSRPQQRIQLTFGLYNDTQPSFSQDGSKVYFVSDRTGEHNLYAIELATETVYRYTNILHGAFFPHELAKTGELMFSNYSDGVYDLYAMELPEPIETFVAVDEAIDDEEIDRIEAEATALANVELSDQNRTQSAGGGWHIANVQIAGGYSVGSFGGTVLTNTLIEFQNLMGTQSVTAVLGSVQGARNYTGIYRNSAHRWNWGAMLTSQRSFFFTQSINGGIDRNSVFELDGGELFADYPFTRDWRAEFSLGYFRREYLPSNFLLQSSGGHLVRFADQYHGGNYMSVGVKLIGDKARFKEYGPYAGRRVSLGVVAAPPGTGTLNFYDVTVDLRQYVQVTKDSQLAFRVWASGSFGYDPSVFYIGGLNQLRGYDYLRFSGNRAVLGNIEYRFPLIFESRAGDFVLRNIRGLLFLDTGAAWFKGEDFNFSVDGSLQDALASFGVGIGVNLVGLPLWFFWAQRTDFKSLDGRPDFQFYIGPLF
jgi:Tol biopolymer transport system component